MGLVVTALVSFGALTLTAGSPFETILRLRPARVSAAAVALLCFGAAGAGSGLETGRELGRGRPAGTRRVVLGVYALSRFAGGVGVGFGFAALGTLVWALVHGLLAIAV